MTQRLERGGESNRGLPVEVARGVYRLGSPLVNWYLVEEGGRLTLIDAGLSGYWPQLTGLLARLGSGMDRIEAVVLTHGHPDHIGNAARVRDEASAAVWIHEHDSSMAAAAKHAPPRAPLWRWAVLRYVIHVVRHGVAKSVPVVGAAVFGDSEVIDVPGRPRVIHAPGHTAGSSALHLAARSVLFAGDALATRDAYTGESGPRLSPAFVNADSEQALASLDRLQPLAADVVLVGHGEPWRQGISEAVRLARRVGIR